MFGYKDEREKKGPVSQMISIASMAATVPWASHKYKKSIHFLDLKNLKR